MATTKYTTIFCEDKEDYAYNAPHKFEVRDVNYGNTLTEVNFQKGPIEECGVNGCNNEDLINMVIFRLQCFQDSEYSCRENHMAITKLEEALLWLRKRTMRREKAGTEGTSKV